MFPQRFNTSIGMMLDLLQDNSLIMLSFSSDVHSLR